MPAGALPQSRLRALWLTLTQVGPPRAAPILGSLDGRLGTVLMQAGLRAAGLSRQCSGRPEVFNVPRGLARCLQVGAQARGVSHSLAVRARGPGGSAPVTGPFLQMGRLVGFGGTDLGGQSHQVSRSVVGRAPWQARPTGHCRASGAGRGPRRGLLAFCWSIVAIGTSLSPILFLAGFFSALWLLFC